MTPASPPREPETWREPSPPPDQVRLRALDPDTFLSGGAAVEVSGQRTVERTYRADGSVVEEQIVEDVVMIVLDAPPRRSKIHPTADRTGGHLWCEGDATAAAPSSRREAVVGWLAVAVVVLGPGGLACAGAVWWTRSVAVGALVGAVVCGAALLWVLLDPAPSRATGAADRG